MGAAFRHTTWLGLLAVFIIASSTRAADDDFDAAFGIYNSNDTLMAWIDLSPVITTPLLRDLSEGLQYEFSCHFELQRPRRLWGRSTVASGTISFKLVYFSITEQFRITGDSTWAQPERDFTTDADLHQWLADSLACQIGTRKELKQDRRYILKVNIEVIYGLLSELTSPGEESQSPVKVLFRHFLQIAGLGEKDYSFESIPFSPLDIPGR